jgi:hypothetical protein
MHVLETLQVLAKSLTCLVICLCNIMMHECTCRSCPFASVTCKLSRFIRISRYDWNDQLVIVIKIELKWAGFLGKGLANWTVGHWVRHYKCILPGWLWLRSWLKTVKFGTYSVNLESIIYWFLLRLKTAKPLTTNRKVTGIGCHCVTCWGFST